MGKSERFKRRYQRVHHYFGKFPLSKWIKSTKFTTIWYQVSQSYFPHWRNRNYWIATIIWRNRIVWCFLQLRWTKLLQIRHRNYCWQTKINCWFGIRIWVHQQTAKYQITSVNSKRWQSELDLDPNANRFQTHEWVL